MLLLTAIVHCLLLSGLAGMEGGAINTETILNAWQYPESRRISSAGGGGGNGREQEMKVYSCSITEADFDTVSAYYRKMMGIKPAAQEIREKEPNVVAGEVIVQAGNGVHMVLEDSLQRPLRLMILNRYWEGKTISVVISRGNGETETHIALSYHEKSVAKKP